MRIFFLRKHRIETLNLYRLGEIGYPLCSSSLDLTYLQYHCLISGTVIVSEENDKNKDNNNNSNIDKISLADKINEQK